jgi:DHA1 family multidrug resistance protein-like MFS transporter
VMGAYQAIYAIGIFAGPFLTGIFNSMLGIKAGFYFTGVLGLVAVFVITIWSKADAKTPVAAGSVLAKKEFYKIYKRMVRK